MSWLSAGAAAGLSQKWLLLQQEPRSIALGHCGSCDEAGVAAWGEPWVKILLPDVATRIGLFLWESFCIADAAVGRDATEYWDL